MRAKGHTKETITDLGIYDRGFPTFLVGDTIAVSQSIKEGDKVRTQVFEGDVIAYRNKGASTMFTVRKISANAIPVERIFPLYAPFITEIKVIRKGRVRRAKLYYLRDRVGKSSRIKEDRRYKETQATASAEQAE